MKLIYCLLVFLTTSCYGASFGDLYLDIRENTRLTILKSATPAYFYEISEDDKDARHKGGAKTPIFEYRFLSADAGWSHSLHTTKEIGTAVLGGSFHLDRFFTQFTPNFATLVNLLFPDSAEKFFDKVEVGVFGGHNFDRNRFAWGLYSGLEFKF